MDSISSIQQFLEYVVGRLARNKTAMSISHREEGENKVQFVIKVDPDDAPRILGKENRGLNSLKSLTIAAAAHIGVAARVYFDGPMRGLASGPPSGRGGRNGDRQPRADRRPGGNSGGPRGRSSAGGSSSGHRGPRRSF
jgi:predicted RNA-binding protein YlqC (UPF0109 family)